MALEHLQLEVPQAFHAAALISDLGNSQTDATDYAPIYGPEDGLHERNMGSLDDVLWTRVRLEGVPHVEPHRIDPLRPKTFKHSTIDFAEPESFQNDRSYRSVALLHTSCTPRTGTKLDGE